MGAPLVVWVLARPDDPGLRLLEPSPEGVRFVVGWELEAFARAPEPDVLLDCWAGPTRLVGALRMAPCLRWIHARSAGLDSVLAPEVVAHPAVLTNGRGAFSPAVGEFAARPCGSGQSLLNVLLGLFESIVIGQEGCVEIVRVNALRIQLDALLEVGLGGLVAAAHHLRNLVQQHTATVNWGDGTEETAAEFERQFGRPKRATWY